MDLLNQYIPASELVAEPAPDPRQIAFDGLRAGTHFLTRSQKQMLATNAAKRAWLQTAQGLPDDVRQRELAETDDADMRIVPMPKPPDEIPQSPGEQIAGQAWVDREGRYSHPGTTWVRNGKHGGWAPDPYAPNNQIDYAPVPGSVQSGMEDVMASVDQTDPRFRDEPVGAPPMSRYHPTQQGRQQEMKAYAEREKVIQKQSETAAKQRMAEEKLAMERQKMEAARQKAEDDRAKARAAAFAKEFKEQLKPRKESEKDAEGNPTGLQVEVQPFRNKDGTIDYDGAEKAAMEVVRRAEAHANPQFQQYHAALKRAFSAYDAPSNRDLIKTMDQVAQYAPSELSAFQDELVRRENGRVDLDALDRPEPRLAPKPPDPAIIPIIQSMSPDELVAFRQHTLSGPPVPEKKFKEQFPDGKYANYLRMREWARTNPSLQVPPQQPKRMGPVPPPPAPHSTDPGSVAGATPLPNGMIRMPDGSVWAKE